MARPPRTPLQLTAGLGRGVQPQQRGGQPLPARRALTLPTWGSPVAPRVSLGKTCPRAGVAREVRLATQSLRAQQPEGGGSNPAPVTEQTAARCGGRLSWRGAGCCRGGGAALHHAPPWPLAASVTPPAATPGEQACPTPLPKSSSEQAGEPRAAARSPGSECLL